jgi:hypothetical protein
MSAVSGKITGSLAFAIVLSMMGSLASAGSYTAPIEHTVTIGEREINSYTLQIPSSKVASWSISVSSGAKLDIYLTDGSNYDKAISGQSFHAERSSESTTSWSGSYSTSGTYYLLVVVSNTASGSSTYTAKIWFGDFATDPSTMMCYGVIAIIILVFISSSVWFFSPPGKYRNKYERLKPLVGR